MFLANSRWYQWRLLQKSRFKCTATQQFVYLPSMGFPKRKKVSGPVFSMGNKLTLVYSRMLAKWFSCLSTSFTQYIHFLNYSAAVRYWAQMSPRHRINWWWCRRTWAVGFLRRHIENFARPFYAFLDVMKTNQRSTIWTNVGNGFVVCGILRRGTHGRGVDRKPFKGVFTHSFYDCAFRPQEEQYLVCTYI